MLPIECANRIEKLAECTIFCAIYGVLFMQFTLLQPFKFLFNLNLPITFLFKLISDKIVPNSHSIGVYLYRRILMLRIA